MRARASLPPDTHRPRRHPGTALTKNSVSTTTQAAFRGVATTGNVTGQRQSAPTNVHHPAGNAVDAFCIAGEDTSSTRTTLPHADQYAVSDHKWRKRTPEYPSRPQERGRGGLATVLRAAHDSSQGFAASTSLARAPVRLPRRGTSRSAPRQRGISLKNILCSNILDNVAQLGKIRSMRNRWARRQLRRRFYGLGHGALAVLKERKEEKV
jgi:hypothetical protein